VTFDQILGAFDHLGLPVFLLLIIGWGVVRVVQGPGNEVVRALVNYLKTAHEQLLTLPAIVREEGERSRDAIVRAHLETRAFVQSLLRLDRPDDTPLPPTPQEPAVGRASRDPIVPVPMPPPPRRATASRPDVNEGGDRISSPLGPRRPPSPSRP
jgi:hypothetical protein